MEIKNQNLERFEIKKPDYDTFDRKYVGMADASFEPSRYVKNGDWWIQKGKTKGLFRRKTARIMFTGDITCFEKQFEQAKNGDDYDFSYEFEKVQPVFAQADLVVGNLETMIFPQAPYRTEKYVAEQQFHCNAPIEFLDAVRKAGFDVLTNANNHDMDTGAIGIGETIDRIEKFGFIQTGTFKEEKKRYVLVDVEGFKIAIMAFATEHNSKGCNLNDEGRALLLNDYSRERAEKLVKDAKADGAELVFCCIHWGRENKLKNNKKQIDMAKELAAAGVDCIIGSHPHVLQPFGYAKRGEDRIPVFYSMGNFISHNANNAKARTIIACIELERKGRKPIVKCSYIPVFTSNNFDKKKYVALPIPAKPKDPRNKEKLDLIKEAMGEKIEMNPSVEVKESLEGVELKMPSMKLRKPDPASIKEYPAAFDDGRFIYTIFEDHVRVDGMSEDAATLSYSTPEKFAGLPVTEIREEAFQGNTIMRKINLKKHLEFISERTCKDCSLLEGFQLGGTVREIREEAFSGCEKLTAIVLGNKLDRVHAKAFSGCIGLRTVKVSPNVSYIAEDAFLGCSNAVFYCEKDTYADRYAREKGFHVVNMNITE